MVKKKTPPAADLTGLAEFLPEKRDKPAVERRIVINVERAEHEAISELATLASEKCGQLVTHGAIIRALLEFYNSYE
jgi:broad specificity phosphatase PhoE